MAEKKKQDKNKKSAYKKIEEIEEKEIEELVEANEKINQKTELPEAFLKRMKELLGGEFPAFLESYGAEMESSERGGVRAFSTLWKEIRA